MCKGISKQYVKDVTKPNTFGPTEACGRRPSFRILETSSALLCPAGGGAGIHACGSGCLSHRLQPLRLPPQHPSHDVPSRAAAQSRRTGLLGSTGAGEGRLRCRMGNQHERQARRTIAVRMRVRAFMLCRNERIHQCRRRGMSYLDRQTNGAYRLDAERR